MPADEQAVVKSAFARSLATIWRTGIAIAGAGFLASLVIGHYEMNNRVDKKWQQTQGKGAAVDKKDDIEANGKDDIDSKESEKVSEVGEGSRDGSVEDSVPQISKAE